MQIGITGLPFSGKTTIFNALTSAHAKTGDFSMGKKEPNRAKVKVPDPRVYELSKLYNPKKTTPAEIEYVDVGGMVKEIKEKASEAEYLAHLRDTDLLLHVVRAFGDPNVSHPQGSVDPKRDISDFDLEMMLLDSDQIDKRLKRLEKEVASTKSEEGKRESDLLTKCKGLLDNETPLRDFDFSEDEDKLLRGYSFLSLKPQLVILNIGEDDIKKGEVSEKEIGRSLRFKRTFISSICGRIEMELLQLDQKDREVFMQDLGIKMKATDKIIDLSYNLLEVISFFTCNENEVKAWTIPQGMAALKAAGTVHTDMEKGFIKAEVINYDKLIELGSTHKAKEKGELRLEGKDYLVKDGDVIFFRFNV
ncbi:MAG: hypothetical protein AMJ90_04130 [candidate division Zixibacteria bacterium SM23_73_2]|nr:MAG: hypothetical protein AMJ90_04130 [candidate division Zixibacteria bacterium SM23_73_2]